MLKMGIESAHQFVDFSQIVSRFGFGLRHAKQSEDLCQRAPGGTKLAVLWPARTAPITSHRGWIRLADLQPMLAKPPAKSIGYAAMSPDRFRWVLLVAPGFGKSRQLQRQRPRS